MTTKLTLLVPLVAVVALAGCQDDSASTSEPIAARHVAYPAGGDGSVGSSRSEVDSDEKDIAKQPWTDFKKPTEAKLKQDLTEIQYSVTQQDGTEPAFMNEYWDNKGSGIYVDVVSGEPLFSSADKYKSGTGWPSFVQPLDAQFIVLREDNTLLSARTEVRSKLADSHVGHVFEDGPTDRGGKRWCMNSAAMRFVAKDQMKAEGYGKYLSDVSEAKE